MMETGLYMSGGILAGLLLASCASSERMTRMSGVLERYEKPRQERIDGFAARVPEEQLAPLDDSLINLWPFSIGTTFTPRSSGR